MYFVLIAALTAINLQPYFLHVYELYVSLFTPLRISVSR